MLYHQEKKINAFEKMIEDSWFHFQWPEWPGIDEAQKEII